LTQQALLLLLLLLLAQHPCLPAGCCRWPGWAVAAALLH
jgi:hypothetical protein